MKTLSCMTIILFPTVVKKKKNSKQFIPEVEQYFRETRLWCYEIFQENNVKKRRAFFTEPIIRYLWKMFITFKPDVVIHHLRRTRSYPYDGEARYKTLMSDVKDTEKLCNVKILPDDATNEKVITLLTPDEAEQDLKETGKFNKRTTEEIRKELIR